MISGLINKHLGPERLCLWDTKLRGGRPDTMKVLKEAYDTWNAEGKFPCNAKCGLACLANQHAS